MTPFESSFSYHDGILLPFGLTNTTHINSVGWSKLVYKLACPGRAATLILNEHCVVCFRPNIPVHWVTCIAVEAADLWLGPFMIRTANSV